MERYERYKDSGVKWIGEIPGHWGMYKLKYLFKLNKNKNIGNKCNTILSLSYGKIKIKKDLNEGLTPESYESYQLLSTGDIVIRSTDLQNDHTSLRTGLVKIEGAITSAYIGLKNLDMSLCDSRFYHYFLHDWDITKAIYNQGKGLRQSLNWDDIKNMLIPVLDISEQTAIAKYLDSTTAKIDEAIAQQQKMIDLLNERKQIIINNAVTKGLNPDAPMKDSGVEWIGKIPEHWEVRKLKHIAKLKSGDTISSDSFTEDGFPVYGGNGFRGYTNRFTNDGEYVLIGRQGALCGNVNYATGKFFASEHAVVVYPYDHENVAWLGEVIRASNLNQYSQSAAQPGLAVSVIENIAYPYPPEKERTAIAEYLAQQMNAINAALHNIERQISLLQERKQIIINDVVTGKVKVL